jgi:carbon monoxide dehydrogenase subunit G
MLGDHRGGLMSSIHVERRIEAPPSRVWDIITDLERSPDVVSGIEAVEVIEGDDFGVGTTWRETRTMFGKRVTEDMRVVDVADGASYTVESRSGGTTYHSVVAVDPDGDGSVLRMSFSAQTGSTVARIFSSTVGRLFEGGTRKALEQDLADIAAAAEAGNDDG